MKRIVIVVALLGIAAIALGQSSASDHGFFGLTDIKWVDGPSSLPKGAKVALLEGNPAQEGHQATVPARELLGLEVQALTRRAAFQLPLHFSHGRQRAL